MVKQRILLSRQLVRDDEKDTEKYNLPWLHSDNSEVKAVLEVEPLDLLPQVVRHTKHPATTAITALSTSSQLQYKPVVWEILNKKY